MCALLAPSIYNIYQYPSSIVSLNYHQPTLPFLAKLVTTRCHLLLVLKVYPPPSRLCVKHRSKTKGYTNRVCFYPHSANYWLQGTVRNGTQSKEGLNTNLLRVLWCIDGGFRFEEVKGVAKSAHAWLGSLCSGRSWTVFKGCHVLNE